MKHIDIWHPILKPFNSLTVQECEDLILAESKSFNKTTDKKGNIVQDFSMFAKKWDELVKYVGLNQEWIYNETKLHGFSIGEVTLRLIELSHKKRL